MKAIAIVFMPVHHGQVLPEQSLALPRREGEQQLTEFARRPPNTEQLSARNQIIPPFWTWFVENPRT